MSPAGEAILDGFADVIGMLSTGAWECDSLVVGYSRTVYPMQRAGLITADEYIELQQLYWEMSYGFEPAQLAARAAG